MIQINLLPKEERTEEPRVSLKLPRAGFWVPLLSILAVALPLAGLSAMQQARVASLKRDLATAQDEMQSLKPQLDKIERLSADREQLDLRLSIIQGICRERFQAVEIMDKLADETPDQLWLTRVAETGPDELTLEGRAFSNLMIAEFMNRMEQDPLFDGISLVVSEKARDASTTERPVLAFTLTARVKT